MPVGSSIHYEAPCKRAKNAKGKGSYLLPKLLTYLAMSRQGTQFGNEDKKLIVQHIFRSASDGLVKDDAAPPSVF